MKEKGCVRRRYWRTKISRYLYSHNGAGQVAIAAILSQVLENVEGPIAYASHQMKKAEREYFASEAEMLTLCGQRNIFVATCMGSVLFSGQTMPTWPICEISQ
jgi:ABC-type enterochelin transport system ATPase subunit